MTKLNQKFIVNCPDTGECEINIKELCKIWKKGFYISEWNGDRGQEFRLIRRGKKATLLKITISNSDAKELIALNDLTRVESGIFRSGASWDIKDK
jgi:hypothetical protein